MSRTWKVVLIGTTVVIGIFAAIKFMPLWATLLAVGTYIFGIFSGYLFKKKEIIEKVVEKPVTVVKEVPVEKIVYRDHVVEPEPESSSKEDSTNSYATKATQDSKPKARKRNKNRKVVE